MKRFWLLVLLMAGTAVVLGAPLPVLAEEEEGSSLEDVNSALGGLAQRVGSIEDVLKLKFYGDMRFREEYFMQDQDNQPSTIVRPNISDRNRLRVRLRFGATKSFGSNVTAGFQLSSGAQSGGNIVVGQGVTTAPVTVFGTGQFNDPTATNATLASDFQMKPIGIDRAFITWAPSFLEAKLKFDLGKMANPLTKSPITWDDDTNPEGIAMTLEPVAGTRLRGTYFTMRENSAFLDAYMLCAQLEQAFKVSEADVVLTAGYQYVPYTNAYFTSPPAPGTAIGSPGAGVGINSNGMLGNAVDAGRIPEFNMVDGILKVSHKVGDVPLVWLFHGAFNYNSFSINPTTVTATAFKGAGYSASNELALFGQLAVGKVANPGDWAGTIEYGYIEPNAVFALFSDSDSGLGFNNWSWFKGSVEVGVESGLNIKISQYAAYRANWDVFGGTSNNTLGGTSHQPVFRTQADAVVKF